MSGTTPFGIMACSIQERRFWYKQLATLRFMVDFISADGKFQSIAFLAPRVVERCIFGNAPVVLYQ
ncbi:hypothetical protein T01_5520 [Trichinella spiralis]|uniref:Uncharacterized protein n=1 Tax=Trichinella spiralis TaxID=6334 RepID=A0A0V1BD17_TRISP|nr:hypothetical protein T01_5520 [Trichinella spiralis]